MHMEHMKKLIFFIILLQCLTMAGQESFLDGFDGPYFLGDSVYYVDESSHLIREMADKDKSYEVLVDNEDRDRFSIQLQSKYKYNKDIHKSPDKMIVISDIEGNFNGFQSFLVSNGVMDKNYNWTYGEGHLVLNGDFVDRGRNVTQVLWLIYKLEQEAAKSGGMVHFILGNHEIMNLQGDIRYVDRKYTAVAQRISQQDSVEESFIDLFSDKSELGQWMRSKNIIERIGPYIFVHAGLSSDIIKLGLSIRKMNQNIRFNVDRIRYEGLSIDQQTEFLFGGASPFWFRGLAMQMKQYEKESQENLEKTLKYLFGQKVVIGHTIVHDICTDYEGRVIKIDLKHGVTKNSGKTKGLLIENGIEYKVDDLGKRVKL